MDREKFKKEIENLKHAMGCILPSDYDNDDPKSKDEYYIGHKEALDHILAMIDHHEYMVLGIKGFPINPNDLLPHWTEADNPYIFGSKEHAQKFVDEVMKRSAEKGSGDPFYHTIVELI